MGLYRDFFLPRAINRTCGQPQYLELRREVAPALRGEVLEIGFGSGLNLPYYPESVTRVRAVDPAHAGRELAAERIAARGLPVEFLELEAGRTALPDASIDSALSTWTLCSIADLEQTLAELRRVLKPGAPFVYLEHGLSPEPRVAKWQKRLTPLHRFFAGNCRLDLEIERALHAAGFALESPKRFYMQGSKISSYMYQGVALAPASISARGSAPPDAPAR